MDRRLEVVPIPVSDVDRATRFYADRLGFTVDVDIRPAGGPRIVQLTPPGSACSIVLGAGTDRPPGSGQGLQPVVPDLAAARERLVRRGVDAGPVMRFEEGRWAEGPGEGWNAFVFLPDPDGNG